MEGLCEWKSKEFCENLKSYLETNFKWMEAMVAVKAKTCPVWHNVSMQFENLSSLIENIHFVSNESTSLYE